jgi:cytochrome d ubiquinol oxidase subunit II
MDVYVSPWLAPFPLAVGGFALSLFAFLAAVYLTVEARQEGLREDFRVRAFVAALMVFVFAALALLLSRVWAPRVAAGVMASPWSLLLHLCTATSAITALIALWRRRYSIARVAAGAQVSFILWGWALSQYPFVLPTTLTIRQAAAPAITLRLLLIGLGAGALILIPSLRFLFHTFAGRAGDIR